MSDRDQLFRRQREEWLKKIAELRRLWEAGDERFGVVPGYVGVRDRILAPAHPAIGSHLAGPGWAGRFLVSGCRPAVCGPRSVQLAGGPGDVDVPQNAEPVAEEPILITPHLAFHGHDDVGAVTERLPVPPQRFGLVA